MKIEEKFIETKLGNICYLEIGEGKKTVVYLHGWFGSPEFALKFQDIFSPNEYRIIAPSLPGHGKSFNINLNFSCIDLKNTIFDFYQKLNLKDAVTIGHSVGGALAWEMAKKVIVLDAYTNPRGKIPFEIVRHWIFSKKLRNRFVKKVHFKPCALLALDIFKNLKVEPNKKNQSLVLWGDNDDVGLLSNWLKLTGYDASEIHKFPGDHWWFVNQMDELKSQIAEFVS